MRLQPKTSENERTAPDGTDLVASEQGWEKTRTEKDDTSTFQSIFFPCDNAVSVRVPDYQRAYSWEQKQIELFLGDLVKYQGVGQGYYFGHFIAEVIGENWEIVDGQQRITTFVLFLMVCRVLSPTGAYASAYSMIEQFSTVSYDVAALRKIGSNLGAFLAANGHFDKRKPPSDEQIILGLSLEGTFTRSQRRMVLALLRFHQAFQNRELDRDKIKDYTAAIMTAHCSHHLTRNKSVAVNIFEMHNTRGIPLTTLEIIKAMLMRFVYEHGGADRESKVEQIQAEFGEIYGMEERLAARSFRGEMEMKHLLHLHLRVVDDGTKKTAQDFQSPPNNADTDALFEYVDSRLRFITGDKTKSEKPKAEGVQYALNLAKEFKKSVRIVSEILPAWDGENSESALVGDVLILERELSCQFFLIVCRRFESALGMADGKIGNDALLLWERLLFTRDFHDRYHGLWYKDNFEGLFEACCAKGIPIIDTIRGYLVNGFRTGHTDGLQSIVLQFLNDNRENILNNAFYWWKAKMIYAIYKYEISNGAKIREVMKGSISVEHILPQDWQWDWIEGVSQVPGKLSDDEKDKWLKEVGGFINGIGNLLLITPGENSSVGNSHPANKKYIYSGGSYNAHHHNREEWRSSKKWPILIRARGEEIFKFMLDTLIDSPKGPPVLLTPMTV